jgi:hypothetical protein
MQSIRPATLLAATLLLGAIVLTSCGSKQTETAEDKKLDSLANDKEFRRSASVPAVPRIHAGAAR